MLIRIWHRSMSRAWHREYRRQGYQLLNSFALHYQAKEKKYQLRKMQRRLGEATKPEKPEIVINSIDEIPHVDYVRKKVKEAIEKVEKVHGPLRFSTEESKDGNPLNDTVDINEEGYKALWHELLKDPEEVPKIMQALQTALSFGVSLLQAEQKKKRAEEIAREKAEGKPEDGKKQSKREEMMASLIPSEVQRKIDMVVAELENVLFSRDLRRVDVGLIVNRGPIFLQ